MEETTLQRNRRLDFHGADAETARLEIKEALVKEPTGTRKLYAALAHKTWVLIIQNAPSGELRDWHCLMMACKAFIRECDPEAAERISALADLLRESISSWETFGLGNRVPVISPKRRIQNEERDRDKDAREG